MNQAQLYPAPMPAPPGPNRWPTWRILDTVVTIALFAVYSVVLLGLLYFSVFWVMATDSCGANDCDYDRLGTALTSMCTSPRRSVKAQPPQLPSRHT